MPFLVDVLVDALSILHASSTFDPSLAICDFGCSAMFIMDPIT